jgi:glycosyltransferase involved in cell wall biosynthesis
MNDISKTYGVDESKILVAWNGGSECFLPISNVDKNQFLTQNGLGQYFVFVGSIHPRKNVQRLINAFTQFQKENSFPEIDLVIVGQPMWKGQRIEIQESMKSKIRFTGHLSQEDLVNYVSSAFALTYVPYFEGFGIPLVEAMRCGIPILSGDRTSLPEIAGDAAIYCDPFDEDQIAEGMKKLFLYGDLRARLSVNGLIRSKLFSWDRTAEAVWEVISTEIQHLSLKNHRPRKS